MFKKVVMNRFTQHFYCISDRYQNYSECHFWDAAPLTCAVSLKPQSKWPSAVPDILEWTNHAQLLHGLNSFVVGLMKLNPLFKIMWKELSEQYFTRILCSWMRGTQINMETVNAGHTEVTDRQPPLLLVTRATYNCISTLQSISIAFLCLRDLRASSLVVMAQMCLLGCEWPW